MTFQAIADMAHDEKLMQRIAGSAATRSEVYEDGGHPVAFASNNAWRIAARPGWANAYAGGGADAITDQMISAAVNELMPAGHTVVPDGV